MKKTSALLIAIALIGCSTAQAAFRSCGAVATGTGNTATINSPAGVQANDVVVLVMLYATTPTLTVPSGFTAIIGAPNQFNAVSRNDSAYKVSISTRTATASEPASYSATLSGSYPWMGVSCAFSGRNTTSPVTADAITSVAGSASPVTVSLTGVTAAAGDDVLWIASGSKNSVTVPTWTAPSSYTNESQGDFTTGPYPHFDLAVRANVAAGATGALSGTETGFALDQQGFVVSLAASGGSSCTHQGITSAGAFAIPNGTSGSYRLKSGAFGTPDCSTVSYRQQSGAFGVN